MFPTPSPGLRSVNSSRARHTGNLVMAPGCPEREGKQLPFVHMPFPEAILFSERAIFPLTTWLDHGGAMPEYQERSVNQELVNK